MQRRLPLATVAAVAAALAVTAALTTSAHGAPSPAAARELSSQDLATAGTGSPHYRIPALTKTTKGTLLASYDARPTLADLPGHIGVVIRRSTDSGASWQPQQVVRKDPARRATATPASSSTARPAASSSSTPPP